jgi:hypothetical protein
MHENILSLLHLEVKTIRLVRKESGLKKIFQNVVDIEDG